MATERKVITRIVRKGPDDVEKYVPESTAKQGELLQTVDQFPLEHAHRSIDAFFALQLGMWQILSSLTMYSIDTIALLRGKLEQRAFEFEHIFFDWAEMKDDRTPNNAVVIMNDGPTRYTYSGRETVLLEDTVDVFCPGTVLKRTHSAEVTLSLVSWLSDKDDRGGVRRALEDAFDESDTARAGRRVVIPQYWEQSARYSLQEITYADGGESATDNTWPLVVKVAADIDVVKLVRRPGYIKGVRTQVAATTDDIG